MDIRAVYKDIEQQISSIATTLSEASKESSKEGNEATILDSTKTFQALQESSQKELKELEANAEFDTFTIAFYGETNAGKSTIIEALRLSFQEKSKHESQAKFRELCVGLDIESMATLQEESETLQEKIANLTTENEQKKKDSFWYRLKNFFGMTELSKTLANSKKHLLSLQGKLAKLEPLKPYADGSIIGARTDQTREIVSYRFNAQNGEEFILLDTPGIEGGLLDKEEEKHIKAEIKKAVQKAHCVFYVTKNNTPPQSETSTTPDGAEQKGVLEIIKEGLRAQSEVWTIYNKRTKSIASLESKEGTPRVLLEQRDAKAINNVMQKALGEHYKGTQALSAYFAFLSLATCLLPTSEDKRAQDKISKEKSQEHILTITHFKDFKDFLTQKLLNNATTKIKQSTYNKARRVVKDCEYELNNVLIYLNERYKELKGNIADCHHRLENAANECEQSIKRDVESIVDDTISKIRNKMYDYIETDVSDNAVQSKLKNTLEQEFSDIKDTLEESVKKVYKECEENIKDALERLKRDIEYLLEEMQSFQFQSYDSNLVSITTKSGFEVGTFIGGVVGIIGAAIFTGGWVLAIGVIAGVIAIGKSVLKALSKRYKMSEQRKSVDNALDNIEESLKDNIEESLKPNMEALRQNIEAMQEKVQGIQKRYESHLNHLRESQSALKKLAQHITTQGGL